MRRIETEPLAGAVRAVAKTVPDFLSRFFSRQNRIDCGANFAATGDEHQHRLGFGETGQVLEIAVGAVGKVRVAIARLLRRRGDQGDAAAAAAHAFDQEKSAPAIRREASPAEGW
jgi:hypothetical protein